jgi:uncharacterized membrane protein
MDLIPVPMAAGWIVGGWLAALPLLAWALRVAPWSRFAASETVNVFCGAIFCLVAFWNIQATVGEGFTFHVLGVAAFTLFSGPALALAGGAVVVALEIAVRGGLWANAGLAFVTMIALPVVTVTLTRYVSERWLPPNFFIYIFVIAFFGAGLSLAAAGIAGAAALTWGAGRPAALVFGEYVPYLIYLAFGEATLTGMVITLAVVYRPRWVASFDDARYIVGR